MTKKYGELVQDLENSTNRWAREVAAEALGRLGDAHAAEPLTIALGDKDSNVRKAAARALDRLGWKPEVNATGAAYWTTKQDWARCLALGELAVDSLIVALGDQDRWLRKAVAETLGKSGSNRAVNPLITALGDKDSDVREAAAEALGRLDDTRAVESLITALRDSNSDVRKAAAGALGRLGDARAVQPLVATLRDIYGNVRSASAEALDRLKWKPQTDERKVDYWIAKEDWDRCADIGEPAMKPLVDLIDPLTPSRPPAGADDTIRHILAKRFGSYTPVMEAARKHWCILVSDDERDIRELIGFTLRSAGFYVVLTADGFEAIEKASLEQPDLILLDIRMPKISGYEVCRRLKENPATSSIPVAFLSAKSQEGEIKQGLDSGAVEYWTKPFRPDELTCSIKDLLRRIEFGIYEED